MIFFYRSAMIVLFAALFTVQASIAGILTNVTATTTSTTVAAIADYTFGFTTATVIPASGAVLEIEFPGEFTGLPTNGTDICARTIITLNGKVRGCDNGSFVPAPNTLYILSTMGSVSAGSDIMVSITGITNPATVGIKTFVRFQTASAPNTPIDTAATLPAVTLVARSNSAPTDIALSSNSISQAAAAGSVVGLFSTVDADSTLFTYLLVPGTGATHNSLFSISGNELRFNGAVVSAGNYNIRARSTDEQNLSFEKEFSISITLDGADLDNDGFGNNVDTDDDGDGMSDVWETANGLNSLDNRDAANDADGDGVTNLAEFNANTNPKLDDYPPVFETPQRIVLNATGLLTVLPNNIAPKATDIKDGPVTVTLSGSETANRRPGRHMLNYQAKDAAGNTAQAQQTVDIWPRVSLGQDFDVGAGVQTGFTLTLNGQAPEYPFTVTYQVGGTASVGNDHDLRSGEVTFDSGAVASRVAFNTKIDAKTETSKTIVVTLSGLINTDLSDSLTVNIVTGNLPPAVNLNAVQSGENRVVLAQDGGLVEVIARVTDPNGSGTYTFSWDTPRGVDFVVSPDGSQGTISPAGLAPGVHRFAVTVSDSGSPVQTANSEIWLNVQATLPALGSSDRDGDGMADDAEGYRDSDDDGVADYLDAFVQSNVQPADVGQNDGYLLETEPGLVLILGPYARQFGADDAGLTIAETQAGAGQDTVRNIGGYFDFIVRGLAGAGRSVQVVIPQRAPVPAQALLRKFDEQNSWSTFIEDNNNSIASAAGAAGNCPPPGSRDYAPGLIAGSWCVQLSIQDGGPNDADHLADTTVRDPSGVGVVGTDSTIAVTGGGLTSFGALLTLMAAAFSRRPRKLQLTAFVVILTTLSIANAQQPGKKATARFPGKTLEFPMAVPVAGSGVDTAAIGAAFYAMNQSAPWYMAGSAVPAETTAKDHVEEGSRSRSAPVQVFSSPWYLAGSATRVGPSQDVAPPRVNKNRPEDRLAYDVPAYLTQSARKVSSLRLENRRADIAPASSRPASGAGDTSPMPAPHESTEETTVRRPRNFSAHTAGGSRSWYLAGSVASVSGEFNRAPIDSFIAQHQDQVEVNADGVRTGHRFTLGYLFSRRWGLELGYTNLGEVNVTAKGRTSDPQALSTLVQENTPTTGNAYTLGATFNHWISRPWVLALQGGALALDSKRELSGPFATNNTESIEYGLYVGGGVQWRISNSVGIGASYQRVFADGDGIDVIDAMLVWQPGR